MLAPSQELSETTSEVNIKDGDNFPSPCEKLKGRVRVLFLWGTAK